MTTDTLAPARPLLGRLQIRHLYPVIVVAILYPLAASGPVRDNSFLWHVRAGEVQWDLGQVLTADPFSYTMLEAPWRTQSWLAELWYYWLEAATGTVGWSSAMVAVVGVVTMALIGMALYGSTRSTATTALWLFIAVWLAAPFANPRPVIFSYLLLAALVLTIRLEDRALWAVVPLMWVWGALHGSWLIGIGLLVLEAIRRRSWKVVGLAGLSTVAVSLTAHGLGTWQIVWEFAANRDALDHLVEWAAPEFADIVQGPYLLVVAGIVLAATRGRIQTNDLWIVIPFLLIGLTTQRTVFPAAIVLLPFAAMAIDLRVPTGSNRRSGPAWIIAGIVSVIGLGIVLASPGNFDEARFPDDEVLAALEGERFFHDDAVGGYLIYRDWPDQLVYIDDRAELYGAEAFEELSNAKTGTYQELFARYDMTEAIVRSDWTLDEALLGDGWLIVYEDDDFIVMRSSG